MKMILLILVAEKKSFHWEVQNEKEDNIFYSPAMLTSTYIFSETSKKSSEKTSLCNREKKPCIECYNMHPEITPLDENGLRLLL
jgi:hypothetical protein